MSSELGSAIALGGKLPAYRPPAFVKNVVKDTRGDSLDKERKLWDINYSEFHPFYHDQLQNAAAEFSQKSVAGVSKDPNYFNSREYQKDFQGYKATLGNAKQGTDHINFDYKNYVDHGGDGTVAWADGELGDAIMNGKKGVFWDKTGGIYSGTLGPNVDENKLMLDAINDSKPSERIWDQRPVGSKIYQKVSPVYDPDRLKMSAQEKYNTKRKILEAKGVSEQMFVDAALIRANEFSKQFKETSSGLSGGGGNGYAKNALVVTEAPQPEAIPIGVNLVNPKTNEQYYINNIDNKIYSGEDVEFVANKSGDVIPVIKGKKIPLEPHKSTRTVMPVQSFPIGKKDLLQVQTSSPLIFDVKTGEQVKREGANKYDISSIVKLPYFTDAKGQSHILTTEQQAFRDKKEKTGWKPNSETKYGWFANSVGDAGMEDGRPVTDPYFVQVNPDIISAGRKVVVFKDNAGNTVDWNMFLDNETPKQQSQPTKNPTIVFTKRYPNATVNGIKTPIGVDQSGKKYNLETFEPLD